MPAQQKCCVPECTTNQKDGVHVSPHPSASSGMSLNTGLGTDVSEKGEEKGDLPKQIAPSAVASTSKKFDEKEDNKNKLYVMLWLVSVVGGKFGYVPAPLFGERLQAAVVADEALIPDIHIAKGLYKNEIFKNGWAFLEISTREGVPDELQARAAGFLEGYLTRKLIWLHWVNLYKGFCTSRPEICTLVDAYLDRNDNFVFNMAQGNMRDPYWYQVLLFYRQLQGLAEGYNAATTKPDQRLTFRDVFWLNMIGDLDELGYSLLLRANLTEHGRRGAGAGAGVAGGDPGEADHFLQAFDHCTGLVKLLPDLSDLFTSQVTWNSYHSMLRLQKMYKLNLRESCGGAQRIAGYKMSLSSYPGILQILEFVRAMVANRLARDGREWCDIFSKYNSGTYNNQWYIVDYNKFEAASEGKLGHVYPGLLWVVEQLPGTTEAADLTEELAKTTYFASYNIPYFWRMFALGGGPERVAVYGDWFGQYTNPRAIMLMQMQANVNNMKDMLYTMRYNDYKNDPLARCADCDPPYSACNAIAARNDLNPANGTYPFRALGHRNHGATDAKITSSQLRAYYQFVAQSGPPHNDSRGIPPFSWSKFDLGRNVSHLGQPDTWVFPAVRHRWHWL